jgi:MFS family permease
VLAKGASEFDIKWWHQVIDACFLFGAAAGGLVFGWLGDRIGRVKAMAFSILVYSGFTGLLYFRPARPSTSRRCGFIAAIGMGGEWALGVALVMEVWSAKYRPLLAGMIGAAANVGFLIVGSSVRRSRSTQSNWRYLALVGAGPGAAHLYHPNVRPGIARLAGGTGQKTPTRPLTRVVRRPPTHALGAVSDRLSHPSPYSARGGRCRKSPRGWATPRCRAAPRARRATRRWRWRSAPSSDACSRRSSPRG